VRNTSNEGVGLERLLHRQAHRIAKCLLRSYRAKKRRCRATQILVCVRVRFGPLRKELREALQKRTRRGLARQCFELGHRRRARECTHDLHAL
jgi:hypothetical protein